MLRGNPVATYKFIIATKVEKSYKKNVPTQKFMVVENAEKNYKKNVAT